MPDQRMNEIANQMGRMVMPFQRYGALMLDSVDKMASFQLGAMQAYSHFALKQARDALEVHDQRSMRNYLEKQTDALKELSQRVSEDAQKLTSLGQEFTSQAQRVTEQNMRSVGDVAQMLERTGQQEAQRAAGTRPS